MFTWLYTDRFSRQSFFRRFIQNRTTTFRTFLDFCTTLETYLPVILYRFHFVDNMRNAFYVLDCGFVFRNGTRADRPTAVLRFGDIIELFFDDLFKWLSFRHLMSCLPTLRFRLTLRDSIVNTGVFYTLLARAFTFFSLATTNVISRLDTSIFNQHARYFNPQYLVLGFLSFFLSRVFLTYYRFDPFLRYYGMIVAFSQRVIHTHTQHHAARGVHNLWWYVPGCRAAMGWKASSILAGDQNRVVERDKQNVPDFLSQALDSIYSFQGTRILVN